MQKQGTLTITTAQINLKTTGTTNKFNATVIPIALAYLIIRVPIFGSRAVLTGLTVSFQINASRRLTMKGTHSMLIA